MDWLKQLLKTFITKPAPQKPRGQLAALPVRKKEEKKGEIDWSDPSCKIGKYFTVKEACLLPSWGIMHEPSEEEKKNILKTAKVMDWVREHLGMPIRVHVWIRPNKVNNKHSDKHGQDYNAAIGGASRSSHVRGMAVDWSVAGMSIDAVLDKIEPFCGEWKFALENNGSTERIASKGGTGGPRNWVHLQVRPLSRKPYWRIFNP